jgi:hypothetical protein
MQKTLITLEMLFGGLKMTVFGFQKSDIPTFLFVRICLVMESTIVRRTGRMGVPCLGLTSRSHSTSVSMVPIGVRPGFDRPILRVT